MCVCVCACVRACVPVPVLVRPARSLARSGAQSLCGQGPEDNGSDAVGPPGLGAGSGQEAAWGALKSHVGYGLEGPELGGGRGRIRRKRPAIEVHEQ